MSDDKIIPFHQPTEQSTERVLTVLQCDSCTNMSWLVEPEGVTCTACRGTIPFDEIPFLGS